MKNMEQINKRFTSHFYAHGKPGECFDPPPYLTSYKGGGARHTKIPPWDIPPWYVPITHWNTRYVDTSRVSDIVYRPVRIPHYNHLFKDDSLYLAYDGAKITLNERGTPEGDDYEILWGYEILQGLFSAQLYSGIDISRQLEEVRAKVLRYNEEYNEPFPDPGVPYDPDKLFEMARQDVQERKTTYETLHPGTHCP